MTEQRYVERIKHYVDQGELGSKDVIVLVNEAVQTFPRCAELWLMHAKTHACCDDEEGCCDGTALASFLKCIELDPQNADAHEDLGHFYDGVKDNPDKAMEHYRKAAELRGNV